MATYTVRILGQCSGGEHISLRVYKDGGAEGNIDVTMSDLLGTELAWRDVIPFLLRKAIQNAGASTPLQRKAAIEAVQVTL